MDLAQEQGRLAHRPRGGPYNARVTDVTDLLARWNQGDRDALASLMPLVYGELRRLAEHYMSHEQTGHTLQPTALVHEAYLRLAGTTTTQFNNRVHFYGAAAQAMRRILVDHARRGLASKRGHRPILLSLDGVDAGIEVREELVQLDAALTKLATQAERAAREARLQSSAESSSSVTALDIWPVQSLREDRE